MIEDFEKVVKAAFAAATAARVGYEGPSQFSREFKRVLERSPMEEVRHIQAQEVFFKIVLRIVIICINVNKNESLAPKPISLTKTRT